MKTVKQVSKISGISVRTLQYYDKIGLLSPAEHSRSGYRLYDDECLEKLRYILIFRELGFELKKINAIINSPDFDVNEAIKQQIKLLEMKKKRTESIITLAENILNKGADSMDFHAFDKKEAEQYEKETELRWGKTEAYAQSRKKAQGRTDTENSLISDALMKHFVRFSEIKNTSPDGEQAQALVKQLQHFISESYYNCTREILSGLGLMYACDERFKSSIDLVGGEGTAEFVSEAIAYYTK